MTEKSESQRIAESSFNVALMYLNGCATPDTKWPDEMLDSAIKAVEAAIPVDQKCLPPHAVDKDISKAIEWLKKSADGGFIESLNYLGAIYGAGVDVERDLELSTDFFRRSAELGDANGQHNFACSLFAGRGVARDFDASIEWFTKAAMQGHTEAQFNLGVIYEDEHYPVYDMSKAVSWFTVYCRISVQRK